MNKYTKTEKLLIILLVILILVFICFDIWAFANYGDKPIHEIPSWVNWLMFRK